MKQILKLIKKLLSKKQKKQKPNHYFNESEWKDARDFAMFGDAHYDCGDKD